MARLVYMCERKGLPKLEDQRAALSLAGINDDEMAGAYVDRCLRKPEQPERDHMIGASRETDEVWVARPAVIATTEGEALRFAAAISEHGAVLRVASTGGTYRILPAVADALLLVAAIRADERKAVMERARKGLRGKSAGKEPISKDRLEAARGVWFDHTLDSEEAAKRTGIAQRTLYRYFGKRDTPAFGKALNMRRNKQ